MDMVSMHHESGEGESGLTTPVGNDFPWGLCLRLSEYELAKLGIDPENLPVAGGAVHLEAVGIIKRSATEDFDADGDIDSVCLEVQITHLGMEQDSDEEDEEERAPVANRLYGAREG